MPSPFPGVDPYLESQWLWEDFHQSFITYAREAILEILPDHYDARIEQRLSLVAAPDERIKHVLPDVAILRRPSRPAEAGHPPAAGVATLEPVTIPFATAPPEEILEPRIVIHRRSDRSVVTAIELLSPSNKVSPGRELYERKRAELIGQPIHLVEVDLLSAGQRLSLSRPLPAGHDYAFVAYAARRPDCDVYAWSIRRPLPIVPLPLLAPDADLPFDLAAVFADTYARGRFGRSIDYAATLAVPLSPEDREWAEGLARFAAR